MAYAPQVGKLYQKIVGEVSKGDIVGISIRIRSGPDSVVYLSADPDPGFVNTQNFMSLFDQILCLF
jgi:hypothetical protein